MRVNALTKKILACLLIFAFISQNISLINAQNLDSANFTLVAPTIGNTVSGTNDSSNFSQLLSVGLIDSTRFESSNFLFRGGYSALIEPNVPEISCFETNTDFSSTNCTGVPGSDGMFAVCAEPGCYNRGKIEINPNSNPKDIRYAIQISTSSDFSNNVFFVDATTRRLKATLSVADFVPKCEWEGVIEPGICASANSVWQKYNLLGLTAGTTYYARIAAASSLSGNNNFQQTNWSPSASATTSTPTISFDIDIASDISTSTNQPYNLNLGTLSSSSVNASSDNIVLKKSTNALGGLEVSVKGNQGYLLNTLSSDQIPAINGDLAAVTGYGIRNVTAGNSAENIANLGNINVSTSPIDFSDSGASTKVGGPSTIFTKLLNSNNLPLDTGVASFKAKAKPSASIAPGSYTETLTFLIYATF